MKHGYNRKLVVLLEIVVLLMGVILLLVYRMLPAESQWRAVSLNLGTAFAGASLLAMLFTFFGADTLSLIEQSLGWKQQAYGLGLEAVHLDIGNESIFDLFPRAHTVDMIYNTAKNTCHRYGKRLADAMVDNGCRVRLLVSDPDSAIWQDSHIANGLCPGTNIRGEIDDVLKHLDILMKEISEQHKRPRGGSLEVRAYPCLPTSSIVIVDGEIVRHTPYLPYRHSSEVPAFDITSLRGGVLFNHYQDTFNRMWDRSNKILMRVEF